MLHWIKKVEISFRGVLPEKESIRFQLLFFLLILVGFISPHSVLGGDVQTYDIAAYLNAYDILYAQNEVFSEVVIFDFQNRRQAIEIVPALLSWVALAMGLSSIGFFYLLAIYFSYCLGTLIYLGKKHHGIVFCLIMFFLIPYYQVNGYRFWSGLALVISGVISRKRHYLILAMFTHSFFFPISLLLMYLVSKKRDRIVLGLAGVLFLSFNYAPLYEYLEKFWISSIDSYKYQLEAKTGGAYQIYTNIAFIVLLSLWSFRYAAQSKYRNFIRLIMLGGCFFWYMPGLGRLIYLLIPFSLLDKEIAFKESWVFALLAASIISFLSVSYLMRDVIRFLSL